MKNCRTVSLICLTVLFLVPVFLRAQTAGELNALLETSEVSCAQAARFVLASAGGAASAENADSAGGAASAENAFEEAVRQGWLPKGLSPGEPVTLGRLSFLLMKAFGMKGGMMYAIFPGQRYAFRSMTGNSIIQGAADPAMTVSGERFLLILGNTLNAAGGE
ncbi:MAG: hypothetical protein FWH38_10105 [Treponema sp.]|nr:hypothetical protein [Treponema sp.]